MAGLYEFEYRRTETNTSLLFFCRLDHQIIVLREMPFALTMARAPQFVQTVSEPLNYDEDEATELSLNALASSRFMPAMEELMQAGRTVETTDSGVTEDGTQWTSAEGSTANGHWYSFSMSLSQPVEEMESSFMNPQMFDEDMAARHMELATVQASEWDDYRMEVEANESQEPRRHHAGCMLAAAACVLGVVAAAAAVKFWARRPVSEGAASAGSCPSVEQPLLSPLSPERPPSAGSAVVVAAHHADFEKHYVDIAYVPLKGEN